MTEADWNASSDPAAMLAWLTVANLEWTTATDAARERSRLASDRKLRLFSCACHRLAGLRPTDAYAHMEADGERWHQNTREDDAAYLASLWADDSPVRPAPPAGQKAALLRDIIGNPFRPLTSLWLCQSCGGVIQQPEEWTIKRSLCECTPTRPMHPWLAWNDGTVPRLAAAIYEERAFERTPILADALEDAGCTDRDILMHLRGWERCLACGGSGKLDADHRDGTITCRACSPYWGSGAIPKRGPCVRGCAVLDLLLGKE